MPTISLAASSAGAIVAVKEAAGSLDFRPTTFEALTAMALLAFRAARVEIAVLEVGLGGRLDATNVVAPQVACVTPISFDHMEQLGNTLAEIAAEKAGIITGPAPVVLGPQPPEALAVLEEACRRAGARVWGVGRELHARDVCVAETGTTFTAVTPAGVLAGLSTPLVGRHQADNALVALGAAGSLPAALVPGEAAVRAGLAAVAWPGRLQCRPGDARVWVDGAHNAASGESLAAAVRQLWPGRRLALVFAMLRGKDVAGTARALFPLATAVFLPELRHPRRLPAAELEAVVAACGTPVARVAGVAEAVAAARSAAGSDGVVLATGSLALAGEVLSLR